MLCWKRHIKLYFFKTTYLPHMHVSQLFCISSTETPAWNRKVFITFQNALLKKLHKTVLLQDNLFITICIHPLVNDIWICGDDLLICVEVPLGGISGKEKFPKEQKTIHHLNFSGPFFLTIRQLSALLHFTTTCLRYGDRVTPIRAIFKQFFAEIGVTGSHISQARDLETRIGQKILKIWDSEYILRTPRTT